MEEIEIYSWATLDALKKVADIIETVGSLNESHQMSVFCLIEDDYLELCYTDSASSFLRHFQDEVEFAETIEERKIEIETGLYEADIYEDEEEIPDSEDDSEKF